MHCTHSRSSSRQPLTKQRHICIEARLQTAPAKPTTQADARQRFDVQVPKAGGICSTITPRTITPLYVTVRPSCLDTPMLEGLPATASTASTVHQADTGIPETSSGYDNYNRDD